MTKAARLLGVHPNTIRTWSDQGRLRYYRINPRGDRRYRLGDLQGFLAAAEAADSGHPANRGTTAQPAVRQAPAPENGHVSAATRSARRRADRLRAVPPGFARDGFEPLDRERHRLDLRVIAEFAALTSGGRNLDRMLAGAVALVQSAYGYLRVAAYERSDDSLILRAVSPAGRAPNLNIDYGTAGKAIAAERPVHLRSDEPGWEPVVPEAGSEIAVPVMAGSRSWGVLVVSSETPGGLTERDVELLDTIARQFAVGVHSAGLMEDAAQQLHRLDALRRVAGDIGSRLDLEQTLAGLADHAAVLFQADRVAVFLRRADGRIVPEVARGLSPEYLASVRDFPTPSLPGSAVAARRPLFAVGYADDPRGGAMRAAVVQEGFDTLCTAPMFDGTELLGMLNVYHDRPHQWASDELDTMAAFATQAAVAIRTAQNYSQMATWAAQLQSIQQLGARLNRLTSVKEIGLAIATELRQLLDFHNARVYRLYDEDLIPVAMQGQVGEYVDETPEQLKVRLGEGITGWVAAHKVAQNLPDAAKDPRANTIPGTEEDLDESMLLVPMVFEDQVLGVVVLSKLGLNQFTDDDLRLLVIYASFAAQAMANADTAERLRAQTAALERQLQSQRVLLQITESILTTLDSRAVLDQITDRLGVLVRCDNIAIELLDQKSGILRPLTAKGIHATQYLAPWEPGEEGIAPWVVAHNEPQLITDERLDPRINSFDDIGPEEGSLIVVPLRGREG
ncbi:MAG TPA: GAF domain-containing protein, partial [Candidatus Acidoferrum sp.]|nr:GAF domain-containing protein [Candidatus Acidoferrum sp.]